MVYQMLLLPMVVIFVIVGLAGLVGMFKASFNHRDEDF
jgi:hypothetical protein